MDFCAPPRFFFFKVVVFNRFLHCEKSIVSVAVVCWVFHSLCRLSFVENKWGLNETKSNRHDRKTRKWRRLHREAVEGKKRTQVWRGANLMCRCLFRLRERWERRNEEGGERREGT